MTAPPPPTFAPLFRGQIVYIRCVVELPAKERYDDNTCAIVKTCDAGGKPDNDTWFYVPERRCLPRTKLAGEIQ